MVKDENGNEETNYCTEVQVWDYWNEDKYRIEDKNGSDETDYCTEVQVWDYWNED